MVMGGKERLIIRRADGIRSKSLTILSSVSYGEAHLLLTSIRAKGWPETGQTSRILSVVDIPANSLSSGKTVAIVPVENSNTMSLTCWATIDQKTATFQDVPASSSVSR